MLCNLGGQPISCRSLKSQLPLIRSKAFVRSMKAMYSGGCCSLQFCCSWRSENIISPVDLPALKLQACQDDSGEDLAHVAQEGNTAIVVAIAAIAFILAESHNVGVAHVEWDVSFFPAEA